MIRLRPSGRPCTSQARVPIFWVVTSAPATENFGAPVRFRTFTSTSPPVTYFAPVDTATTRSGRFAADAESAPQTRAEPRTAATTATVSIRRTAGDPTGAAAAARRGLGGGGSLTGAVSVEDAADGVRRDGIGPGGRRMRIDGRRLLVALVLVGAALVLAGCHGTSSGAGNGRPGGVDVVAPAGRSQAPASGEVPVDVRVDRHLSVKSLRVWVVRGPWWSHDRVEITDRLVRDDSGARATLHAADLQPGLTTVLATARPRQWWAHDRGRHVHDGVAQDSSTFSWEPAVDLASANRCDVLAPTKCLMPFPNDFFTVRDASSATGRRVHFDPVSMPVNSSSKPIDPTEWNRNDGFSPGAMIVTYVDQLDLTRSGAAPITDIGASLRPDQPIVLLDATTGTRWPFFAELDAQAAPPDRRALIIRPAKNLIEGHRYVVALRHLQTASGTPIAAGRGFQLYRDRIPTFSTAIEGRRPHLERLFWDLGRAGVARHDLFLAWDFTVASEQNLAGRMLHIRDDAFASLQGGAPSFQVTQVENNVDDQIYRRVTGTFIVPSYLTGNGSPGNQFAYAPGAGPDALPIRNGNVSAGFICNVPRSATADGDDPVTPARGGVYGHGLLGSNDEVNAGNVRTMSNAHNFVFCATKWAGFSEDDIGVTVATLQDVSNMPKMSDRTQQGFLNFLFLARLIKDSRGFASDPAFQAGASHTPVLDGTVFYDGNSQGGILGGAVTAISTEWTRAVLGVPGMNYSTLLQRSSDFPTYAAVLNPSYPDELDRIIGFPLLQMLWDRAEADGYAAHMTDDPYPGTPKHQVLMDVAFGDHQVANVTAEIEARTIGARAFQPALAAGRSPDVTPLWGIAPIPSYPWKGSAIVYWDSGNPAPPLGNLPPTEPAVR